MFAQAWIAQTTLAAALQQAATVAAVPAAPPLHQQAPHRAWQQHTQGAQHESVLLSPAVVAPKALRPGPSAWGGSPALPSPAGSRPGTPVAANLAIDLNRAPSASMPHLQTRGGPSDASPSLPAAEAVDAAAVQGMEAAVAAAVEEVRAAAEEQAVAASESGPSGAAQAQDSEVSAS